MQAGAPTPEESGASDAEPPVRHGQAVERRLLGARSTDPVPAAACPVRGTSIRAVGLPGGLAKNHLSAPLPINAGAHRAVEVFPFHRAYHSLRGDGNRTGDKASLSIA
jgi:hypothetical protein